VSQSLGKRIAKLEDRLRQLRARKDIKVVARDFGTVQENVEPVTYRLHPCPGGCGTQVRTGEVRCSGCGEALAWISATTGEA